MTYRVFKIAIAGLMFGPDETRDHNAAALKRVDNWRGLLLDGSVRCVGSDSALVKETWALTLSIFTVGQITMKWQFYDSLCMRGHT